jgi:protocatechuate 3,4-dioxygenase beta subunit
MKMYMLVFCVATTWTGCSQSNSSRLPSSNTKVGGGCEGCESIYQGKIPFNLLNEIDTMPDFIEPGPKLILSGVIFEPDGKTPAKNVVLYIYHTDQTGHYTNKFHDTGWSGRNGYIKGWIKTNANGEYTFYTLKPAPYPGANIPAHIHPIIKEERKNEYWIDEFLFNDDVFLTNEERNKQEGRGGNGILTLEKKNGILYGKRNIILGRKIPDYK